MKKRGLNLEGVKIENRAVIIRLLNMKGPMSRKDIADTIGLTPATVTLLCTEMINQGIIYENGDIRDEKRAGRKKLLLDINYNCKHVISVYIEAKNTYIYICDLKSNPIRNSVLKTDSSIEPEVFLKQIADEIKILLNDVQKEFIDILGMGIAIPGIVNRNSGESIHAYGIWSKKVNIKEILAKYIPCNIIVENNIKAFAKGELLYGTGRKKSNILFLRWGPGVGAAIIIDNKLYEGNENKAMEIGHYIVDPDGEVCKCGKKGCLETKVSVKLICKKINNIFSLKNTPKLYKSLEGKKNKLDEEYFEKYISSNIDITNRDIFDEKIFHIIDESVKVMALAISNAITLFEPGETIVFGTMFDNSKVEELFLQYYNQYNKVNLNKNNIHKSDLSKKIRYIGPTAIVVKELFFEF